MNQAIETLQNYDIPTHSFTAAVKYLNEVEGEVLPELYRDRIKELSGHDTDATDETIRWHYLYLVQETVRQNLKNGTVDMDELFELATEKANTHLKKNPWMLGSREDKPVKLDAAGNPKKKKGAKKEMAIELYKKMVDENNGKFPSRKDAIQRFVDEIGMTPAGASTYVANCKKNFAKGAW